MSWREKVRKVWACDKNDGWASLNWTHTDIFMFLKMSENGLFFESQRLRLISWSMLSKEIENTNPASIYTTKSIPSLLRR